MKKFSILFIFGMIFFTSFSEIDKNFKPKSVYENYDMTTSIYNTSFATTATVNVTSNNEAYLLGDNSLYSGYFIDYYKDGTVKSIKNFKNGHLDGDAYFYGSNGSMTKLVTFKSGSKNGGETEYFADGTPKSYKLYKNDVQDGLEYNYDENGFVKSIFSYKYGIKNGESLKFSNGTLTEKETYTNDRLEGDASAFYANGKVKSSGKFRNDYRDGKWSWYYPDGELKLIETYVNGKVIGDIKGYFPDGSVERNLSLVNGNGDFVQYYDNGILKAKGQFSDYSAAGEWFFYDKNGNLTTTNYFSSNY